MLPFSIDVPTLTAIGGVFAGLGAFLSGVSQVVRLRRRSRQRREQEQASKPEASVQQPGEGEKASASREPQVA